MGNNHQYTAKEENNKTPKNIRQIGITEAGKAVYVEDYVITFLNKLCKEDKPSMQVAVLLGTFQKSGNRQTYVEGAVGITDYVCGDNNRIHFTETKWTEILEEMKQNFPGLEIVGWFVSAQEFDKALEEQLLNIHKEQFREPDAILFYMDIVENEEKIFRNENGMLQSQGGYYIYYEKNKAMQEYMVQYFGGRAEETHAQVPDKAARQFRRMVQEKETKKVKKSSGISYAFATFALLVIFAVGMSVLDNYEKLSYVEEKVKNLTTQVLAISDTNSSTTASDGVPTAYVGEDSKTDMVDRGSVGVEKGVVGSENKTTSTEAPNEDVAVTIDNLGTPGVNQETDTDGNSPISEEPNPTEPEAAQENSVQTLAEELQENTKEATEQTSLEERTENEEETPQNNTEQATQTISVEGRQTYIVEPGDTLEIISLKIYQTTDKVDAIRELNQIENVDKIIAGEKIWLP